MKKLIAIIMTACLAFSMAACGSAATATTTTAAAAAATAAAADSTAAADTTAASGEKYKIAVSNAYMGNDWRQLMIKCINVAATKSPYADEVTVDVVNSENTSEAQSAAIDAMVEQGYDAILINASSSTALITSINRATEAGIKVVTFDNVVKADGVYTVQTDFPAMSKAWATYLVEKCGDGAKIAVDTGMPGSTAGNVIYEEAMAIFEAHNMDVVAEFASQYADGVAQEQLASVLAANPDLEGIFCQAYTESCYSALTQAGMELIPVASFDTNLGMVTALNNNMNVIIGNNAPGVGVIALDVAIRVLKGETVDLDTFITPGMFVTKADASIDVGIPTTVIEEGVNCWADAPDALDWPALPSDFTTITLTIDEISDYAA